MDRSIAEFYGNRVRVRACGLFWRGEDLLLVNHKGLGPENCWIPPGGGVEFGKTIEETLKNEFLEETGLIIKTGPYLFGMEFLNPPLHAIELFFEVYGDGGRLNVGNDPEVTDNQQIIKDVKFFNPEDIQKMNPQHLHGFFGLASFPAGVRALKGFYKARNKTPM